MLTLPHYFCSCCAQVSRGCQAIKSFILSSSAVQEPHPLQGVLHTARLPIYNLQNPKIRGQSGLSCQSEASCLRHPSQALSRSVKLPLLLGRAVVATSTRRHTLISSPQLQASRPLGDRCTQPPVKNCSTFFQGSYSSFRVVGLTGMASITDQAAEMTGCQSRSRKVAGRRSASIAQAVAGWTRYSASTYKFSFSS